MSNHCLANDVSTVNDDLIESSLSLSLSTTFNIIDEATTSTVVVNQYGLHNTININQSSTGTNLANVMQQGNNNIASITQIGANNVVNLLQEGNDNHITFEQVGDSNIANVHQLGEQDFIIRQIGNEMVVNVTQYQN
uniref:curlin subunit CsgB n=1 Tax=Ningiella ruwaisensis TaxID=2364274 RepID=UPI001447499C|nr:curlin subunit CsgB [Ningiella ruwaisensis]